MFSNLQWFSAFTRFSSNLEGALTLLELFGGIFNNWHYFAQDEKNQLLTTNVWLNLVSFFSILLFIPLSICAVLHDVGNLRTPPHPSTTNHIGHQNGPFRIIFSLCNFASVLIKVIFQHSKFLKKLFLFLTQNQGWTIMIFMYPGSPLASLPPISLTPPLVLGSKAKSPLQVSRIQLTLPVQRPHFSLVCGQKNCVRV